MQVPASLDEATLGDVLGRHARARATGALYLIELGSARAGRTHRIHLREGAPVVVASDGARIGQLLADRGAASVDDIARAALQQRAGDKRLFGELIATSRLGDGAVLEACLRDQTQARLEPLFGIESAKLTFIAEQLDPRFEGAFGRAARSGPPLPSRVYLYGRPRRRPRSSSVRPVETLSDEELLGVALGATSEELRRAFRKLAFELHPDRASSDAERRARELRLSRITSAYHRLASRRSG
jgi:hypothetical protein